MVCALHRVLGVYTFANGDKYDGQWTSDKKGGKGILASVTTQVFTHMRMETSMKARSKMTKRTAEACLNTRMGTNMMACGRTIRKTAKVTSRLIRRSLHLQ